MSAVHQVLDVKGCILSGNCHTPCNVQLTARDRGKLMKVSQKYAAASQMYSLLDALLRIIGPRGSWPMLDKTGVKAFCDGTTGKSGLLLT